MFTTEDELMEALEARGKKYERARVIAHLEGHKEGNTEKQTAYFKRQGGGWHVTKRMTSNFSDRVRYKPGLGCVTKTHTS